MGLYSELVVAKRYDFGCNICFTCKADLANFYFVCIDDVVINKHNTIYTNDNRNVTKINELVKFVTGKHRNAKRYNTGS